jgi:hypothetical protein
LHACRSTLEDPTKEKADTVTVMEKIGHFLDDAVRKLYKKAKSKGMTKIEASPYIAEHLNLAKILQKSAKNWDGGYAMAGLLGHGDAFVLRDPAGIRPAYYYQDEGSSGCGFGKTCHPNGI